MNLKFVLKVFIIFFLIVSLIVFIHTIVINLNDISPKVVTIEGLTPPDTSISINKSDAFCENYKSSAGSLDKSCGKLTKNNCNTTSCCIWTSDNKCVAGGINGPIFNSDSNGKTTELDYYYFKNKCYGKKCTTSS